MSEFNKVDLLGSLKLFINFKTLGDVMETQKYIFLKSSLDLLQYD